MKGCYVYFEDRATRDFVRAGSSHHKPFKPFVYFGSFPGPAWPVFNTEQMNQAVFAFRRYEDASLRYTGIDSHPGLTHYGLYDTVVAVDETKELISWCAPDLPGAVMSSDCQPPACSSS